MSQVRATSRPPPTAGPSIAQIVGTGSCWHVTNIRLSPSRNGPTSDGAILALSFRSAPEETRTLQHDLIYLYWSCSSSTCPHITSSGWQWSQLRYLLYLNTKTSILEKFITKTCSHKFLYKIWIFSIYWQSFCMLLQVDRASSRILRFYFSHPWYLDNTNLESEKEKLKIGLQSLFVNIKVTLLYCLLSKANNTILRPEKI